MAHTLLGDGDDEVVNAVCEGTGNNPLFMEERIASLLGTKAIIKADGKWRVAEEASGLISDRVTRLVRSKLDRLAQPQRDILAGATVLRPEFTLDEVGAVTDLGTGLAPALDELCALGLLVAVNAGPQPTFRFRYPIVREVVYEGLLERHRHHLHFLAAAQAGQGAA